MNILGVRVGHDASAALVIDGKIVADVAEERFSRTKNDTSFPLKSIQYCLDFAGISSSDVDVLAIPTSHLQEEITVFFDIPEAVLKKAVSFKSTVKNITKKIFVRSSPSMVLPLYQKRFVLSEKCSIEFIEHHLAHAASACYTSGLDLSEKALVITMDGSGDNTSVAAWRCQNNIITNLVRYNGTASLGWFYANCTEALGWRHGCEEWKVMGLAPYGTPAPGLLDGFHPVFENGELVKPYNFGSFGRWKDHGANHYHGKDSYQISKICTKVKREDFAAEVQRISEEQAFNFILPWLARENTKHLLCAGGFFMNVKFNQKMWYKNVLDTQWIYPNPGDAGLAVGACLRAYYVRNPSHKPPRLDTLYLGPSFNDREIQEILQERAIEYKYFDDIEKVTAKYLSKNYVIGWFQGRMESGPRALGNRSILMSPLNKGNKDIINSKVKYREAFRPFCPSILDVSYDKYLKSPRDEFFMVSSFDANEQHIDKIPAVIHEDSTARPQKVTEQNNSRYYALIKEFGKLSGENVLLNTSFNIKGEPIVCNPREAIKCFYDTGIDVLVMGNYLIKKHNVSEE